MNPEASEAGVQADIPEPEHEEETLKIRPLERIKLYPKVPVEPSAYGKGKNFSRPWILQDGREAPEKGSEMRRCYQIPKKPKRGEGIRKRMLTDFFWEQMLDEVIEELATSNPVAEYCTEYDANYVKDEFEPRNLEVTADKNMHLKYPLYGTGSSAVTFYSETIKKTGPVSSMNPKNILTIEAELLSPKLYGGSERFDTRVAEAPASVWQKYLRLFPMSTTCLATTGGQRDNFVNYFHSPPLVDSDTDFLTFPMAAVGDKGTILLIQFPLAINGEILEKFRRCQYFTRPMEERLDDGWVL